MADAAPAPPCAAFRQSFQSQLQELAKLVDAEVSRLEHVLQQQETLLQQELRTVHGESGGTGDNPIHLDTASDPEPYGGASSIVSSASSIVSDVFVQTAERGHPKSVSFSSADDEIKAFEVPADELPRPRTRSTEPEALMASKIAARRAAMARARAWEDEPLPTLLEACTYGSKLHELDEEELASPLAHMNHGKGIWQQCERPSSGSSGPRGILKEASICGLERPVSPLTTSPSSSRSGAMVHFARHCGSTDSLLSIDDGSGEFAGDFQLLDIWTDVVWRRNHLIYSRMLDSVSNPHRNSVVKAASFEDIEYDNYFERFVSKLVLPPSSPKRLYWECAGYAFIYCDLLILPIMLVARDGQELQATGGSRQLLAFSTAGPFFWTLDLLFQCLLGRMDQQGLLELRPREILKVYLRTWCLLDLACVAADWFVIAGFFSFFGSAEVIVAAIRTAVRRQRLRLSKAGDVGSVLVERFSHSLVLVGNVASMLGKLLLMAHVVCCVWYRLGLNETSGTRLGWVDRLQLSQETLWHRYIISLHWALALFNGEHVTDPQDYTLHELIFTLICLFVFFIISTFFVSSITTALTRLQMISGKQHSELTALRRYLGDNSISRELQARVTCNAKHAALEQQRYVPESDVALLKLISEPLLVELHFEVHSRVFMGHTFFKAYEKVNPRGIRQLCHWGVSHKQLSKGDVVFSTLDSSEHRMLFVESGTLLYTLSQDGPKHATELFEKQWAAEAALWTKWVHRGTLQADSDATLLVLDGTKFQEIISPFPTGHASDYASRFVNALNDCERSELTDLKMPAQDELAADVFPEIYPRSSVASISSGSMLWGSSNLKTARFSLAVGRISTVLARPSSIVPEP